MRGCCVLRDDGLGGNRPGGYQSCCLRRGRNTSGFSRADCLVGFGDEVDAFAGLNFMVGCRYITAFARAIFKGAVVLEEFGHFVPDGVSGLDFAFDTAEI